MADPIQLVIFDLMGTLVVDDGLVEEAYETALVDAGVRRNGGDLDAAMQRVGELRGRPTLVVLTQLFDDPVRAEEATWAFDDAVLTMVDSMQPVTGAVEVLDRLRRDGVRLALTSSFSREVRTAVLERMGWTDSFSALLSAHGRRRGHPAPDLLLEAILELGIDSVSQVAIVGDSRTDLEAGNRAGAGLVIGVLGGADPAERFASAPYTHLVESVIDVPEIVANPGTGGHRRASDA